MEIEIDKNSGYCFGAAFAIQMAEDEMQKFSREHHLILFVAGKKSSNGKALFGVCKQFNPKSYFIESPEDINLSWFDLNDKVGICGATSTPRWLMEKVAEYAAYHMDQVQAV